MKQAILLHNPTAGSGDHKKEDLEKIIRKAGYEVRYYSTDNPLWQQFTGKNADLIVVAGGDGTVQKVVAAMLEAEDENVREVPVQVLPCGTANNIASTLNIPGLEGVLKKSYTTLGYDIGEVKGIKEASFFIEGMGCGIFPRLVQVMDAREEDEKQNEVEQSLKELLKIIDSYEAKEAIIIADNEEITGKFLLIELLNIRYIGPNIELAPNARIGDGSFELVIVREEARREMATFIQQIIKGNSSAEKLQEFAELRQVSRFRLKWKGQDIHVDDEIIENYKGEEINVTNQQGVLKVLSPK